MYDYKPNQELAFLLTINDIVEIAFNYSDEYFKQGYKIIGVHQYKDCDGLNAISLIMGRHNPNKPY